MKPLFGPVAGLLLLVVLVVPVQTSYETSITGTQGEMSGSNMNLIISPASFNPSTDSNVTLALVPNSGVPTLVTDGTVKHLDYTITISQGGKSIFNHKFHTHNGNLTLVFTPSAGQVSVTGGLSDSANTVTGPFYISGPVFDNAGSYGVTADVVGVNFSPITPLEDKFTVQAAPEFGQVAAAVLATAVACIVVLSSKTRAFQKI